MSLARAGTTALLAAAAAGTLAACDVPLGNPPPDGRGDPVGESSREPRLQVIVRLRFDAPDGAAPDGDAYRDALRATREQFLTAIGSLSPRVLRTYDTLPLVVLSIAPADRPTIERLPLVAGVEEDRLNAPLAD